MTEQEWLNCEDPARMITLITKGFDGCIGVPKEKQKPFQYRASDNKLRYWVEACRNQVPSHLRDEWKKIDDLSESVRLWCGTNAWMKECPRSTRANLLREVIGNPFKPIKLPTLMRCRKCSWDGTGPNRKYCEWGSDPDGKYGHDWHQYSPILTWRDGLIPKTAQDIDDNEKWEEMGILADMCEDAGCGNQDLLMHLRGVPRVGQRTTIPYIHCPKCKKPGYRRHGMHFDHEYRCGECKIVWEPGERFVELVEYPVIHCRGCHVLDALTGRE